jgi:hypothetical protein
MQKVGRSISKTLMRYVENLRGSGLAMEGDVVSTLVDQLASLNYVRVDRNSLFNTTALPAIDRQGKSGKVTTGEVIVAYIEQLRTLGGYDAQVRVLEFVLSELQTLGLVR